MTTVRSGKAGVKATNWIKVNSLPFSSLYFTLSVSAFCEKFILSGRGGIMNENDVFISALLTAKSPMLIMSMPIIMSTFTGKSTT